MFGKQFKEVQSHKTLGMKIVKKISAEAQEGFRSGVLRPDITNLTGELSKVDD